MSLKNRIIGLAAVGAAALVLAPTALAKPAATKTASTTTTTTSGSTSLIADQPCTAPASAVFAPWGDNALYSLVDGGSFEAGSPGWSLSGAAKVVRDLNDGNAADEIADAYALELGNGGSATSPAICVATDSASYRMFANAVTKTSSPNLRVEVLFLGTVVQSTDVTSPAGQSVPTQKFALVPSIIDTYLGTFTAGYSTTVKIRVTSLNGASVRVDDLNMDPRMH